MTTIKPSNDPKVERQLFAALEATFNEKTGLYNEGHSDERIAATLGIPVALVINVRERSFGALSENPAITKLKAAVANLKQRIADIETKTLERLTSELTPLRDTLAVIEKQLAEVQINVVHIRKAG